MKRYCLLALFGLLLAGFISTFTTTTAAAADSESFISINFADPKIPDIHVTGVDRPRQPYGLYLTPEAQRARDRAVAELPPPDLRMYELDWESHEGFDIARLQAAAQSSLWGPYWSGSVEIPFEWRWPTPYFFKLRPTPATAHRRYNVLEYNAALDQWRRARERSMR